MTFERDVFFLLMRFIILNVFSTAFLLFLKFLLLKKFVFLDANLLVVSILIILLVLNFPIVCTVRIIKHTLVFKNAFGIIIKKIPLKEIKGRKIRYTHKPRNIPNLLFGKKYNPMCQVTYSLTKGSYSFNGHILSNKGLKLLLNKTKK